jgi:protein-tyrosine phosphatase
MQRLVDENGLEWEIRSAGTGNWHVGQPPDERAIAVAESYGTAISHQRAAHFTNAMFDDFDLIFAMDKSNFENIFALARTESDRSKVKLFLDDLDVPDPYYNEKMFVPVYEMIEKRCVQLLDTYTSFDK